MPSFDIVSRVDFQEIDNAINIALKEVSQRFDLKGSNSTIKREGEEIEITSADDYKAKVVADLLKDKLIKRKAPLKNLIFSQPQPAASGRAKIKTRIVQGISTEKAKEIIKEIKKTGLKVQAQIQESQVRVSGKKIDDLQKCIVHLKEKDFGQTLQFINYRS